jgi:hypothetical protein
VLKTLFRWSRQVGSACVQRHRLGVRPHQRGLRCVSSECSPRSTSGRWVIVTHAEGGDQRDWCVNLVGDRFDLDLLAAAFSTAELSVRETEGVYSLRTRALSGIMQSDEGLRIARAVVSHVNGLAKLRFGRAFQGVSVSQVRWVSRATAGSGLAFHVTLDTSVVKARAALCAIADRGDGDADGMSAPRPTVGEVELAQSNPRVAAALRIFGADAAGWIDYYKVLEIIQEDIGGDPADRGYASKRQIVRFRRTANSPTVVGDAARHGRDRTEPPLDPMTWEEADSLIRSILAAWLADVI